MRRTGFSLRRPALAAAALALATALAACGGGDDDGDSGTVVTDDQAPPLPTAVKFSMGTNPASPLRFASEIADVGSVAISYPDLSFGGTWNRTSKAYTLGGRTNVASGTNLFGTFGNQIVEPLAWVGENPPTAGKLEVQAPALSSPVQAAISGSTVTVTYPGSPTVQYTDVDTFLNAWITAAEPYLQYASFGGTTLSLAMDRAVLVLDLMAAVNANDVAIAQAGAAGWVTNCSPRPGAATGTRKIALANPDGELNPGDTLVVTYTNCWIDDPADDIDVLLNGTITLSNYIENATSTGTFVSTGFGEIVFALSEQETENVGGTIVVDPQVVATAGTLTLFVEPQ